MTQTADLNLDDITIEPEETGLLALLERIAEYRGPGYQPSVLDRGDDLLALLDRGLVTAGPEPLGTYGPDGSEDYGTICHVLPYGEEELMVWAARRAAG